MTKRFAVEDNCPVCNSNNIEWGIAECELPEGVHYHNTCNNCGATFDTWYSVKFAGHYNIESDIIEYNGEEPLLAESEEQ